MPSRLKYSGTIMRQATPEWFASFDVVPEEPLRQQAYRPVPLKTLIVGCSLSPHLSARLSNLFKFTKNLLKFNHSSINPDDLS
jgi:hypothetical protein